MTYKTLLTPECYTTSESFEFECEQLFARQWVFACFASDLANHHDFIRARVADRSVVIKNFHGELVAFHNVCSHRFAQLVNTDKGNGLLKCSYHGWTYDETGLPYAIPNRCLMKDFDPNAHRLAKYPVATCGEFVFVNIAANAAPLRASLGHYADELETLSKALAEKVDTNSMLINANWKIVVENTLEDYHVSEVHTETFHTLGINEHHYNYDGAHSSVRFTCDTKLDKNAKLAKHLASRPLAIEDYQHYFIFPSMTTASAYGVTYSVQQIIPLSETQTQFTSHVFKTHLSETASQSRQANAILNAYSDSASVFNRQVFNEDLAICESVQRGISETHRTQSPLSEHEQRIQAFHEAYRDATTHLHEKQKEGELS